MTTRFRSIGSLWALAASRRRGYLPGGAGSVTVDRDLARVASDLLVLAQADTGRVEIDRTHGRPVMGAVDLDHQRSGGRWGTSVRPTPPRARAS